MIKALIFDLGNVVVTNDWNYVCPEKDREFTDYFGVTMADFKNGWDKAWPLIRVGKITEDEFWRIFLTESGVKNIDVNHAKKLWRKYQSLIPGTLELIMRLRNHYPIVACTDNGKEWVEFYQSEYHLDAYFDEIVCSARVQDHKPNPAIYAEAIRQTGVNPDEILFIDDNDKPLLGARNAGMQTLKFTTANELEKDLTKMNVSTDILDISSRNHSFYWQTDRKISEIQIKHIFQDRHTFFDKENAVRAIENSLNKKVSSLIPPIKSGSINSVVQAELVDKTQIIMRMHPNAVKNGYFWAEKAIAEHAKKAGVPTYSTLHIDDTKTHVPFDFMIITKEPGNNMKNSGPFDAITDRALVEDTGKLLAKTHSVQTQRYGFFDNAIAHTTGNLIGIHTSWKSHIYSSLADNLSYLENAHAITTSEKRSIELVFKKNDSLISCPNPHLIHNDLADWNELTDGKKITAFIDWDEAFSGDPVCDFAAYSVFFDDSRLTHLINGYTTISPLPDDFERKFHLYRLRYIISKMTLRTKRSVYDTSNLVKDLLVYSHTLLQTELKWYEKQ
jgi:HAD superfamily hydrolase (TIGR01509 family)